MAEIDRSKRYANSPKHKKGKGMQDKAETRAESEVKTAEKKEGEDKGPTDKKPGAVGKENEDKGPSKNETGPEFGVVAERHKREHGDMIKRHTEAMSGLHEAHAKEAKEMMGRHHKEMQDHMEQHAEGEEDATAGKPEELGKDKAEGEKGSND